MNFNSYFLYLDSIEFHIDAPNDLLNYIINVKFIIKRLHNLPMAGINNLYL